MATADQLLGMLPPFVRRDPTIAAVQNAVAGETGRIDAAMQEIRDNLFPVQTTDVMLSTGTVVMLASMWEALLGLPVNPAGIDIVERRRKITAHIQKRHSSKGSDWVATITAALGSTPWSYEEGPGDYVVTVHVPHSSGTWSAEQLLNLVRQITPAHLDIIPSYTEGFLVGISLVGVEAL